jgi:CubicO group peptidase (beta-lactamase class C family)
MTSVARIGALLLLALGSTAATAAEHCARAAPDPRYSQIQAMMAGEFAKSTGAALSIGILEHGCLASVANFGTMGPGRITLPTDNSIYPIASITKVVTGIMLLQLVERGKVHLTDPVVRYVPEFRKIQNPYPWAPAVTLIQLATMTSGIGGDHWTSSGFSNDEFASDDADPTTWDQRLAKQVPNSAYHFEPGTRHEYSNVGYGILGLALSRAAHRSFIEYVTTEILRPLGMTDTSFSIDQGTASRFAFAAHGMPALPSWRKHPLLPAAGLFTTVDDLAKLMQFQLGLGPEAVLSHKALEQSLRLVVPSDGDLRYGDGVGYSAVRNSDGDLVALGHGGETLGYIASYEYDRAKQSGVIVLTSHRTNEYKPLVRKALKLLNPGSDGGTGLNPTEEH